MRFSILIPAYKKKYLEIAIQSVLSQTFDDWELVVLNDCSPEDIKTIISKYDDKRIAYYENDENCGAVNVVDNWNKCLKLSSGEYVICIGDDDVLDHEALAVYDELIKKHPDVGVFHTSSIIIDEEGIEKYVTHKRPEYESAASFLRHRLQGEEQFIGDNCFKSNVLKDIGGFVKLPLAWGSDDLTILECAKSNGIVNLQSPVFYYRASSITISRTGNTDLKMQALRASEVKMREFINDIPNNGFEALEKQALINRIDNYFTLRHVDTIAEDIAANRLGFFKWLIKRRRFNLKWIEVIMGMGISLRK